MSASKGYYSLIQYCPDLGRFEAANVGVLLFCPDRGYLKAKTASDNRRIQKFFGRTGNDWERINAFKAGLNDRLQTEAGDLQTVDALRQFIAGRANAMQITDPLPILVTDHPDRVLDSLFVEVMGEPQRRTSKKTLRTLLAAKLSVPEVSAKLERNVAVRVPVRGKSIEVPYAFRNGRFNLIEPVSFQAGQAEANFNKAAKYAVEGRSLYDSPDSRLGELQLLVVGQFRPQDKESRRTVQQVLGDNKVRLFPAEELNRLVEEIRLTGKDPPSKN